MFLAKADSAHDSLNVVCREMIEASKKRKRVASQKEKKAKKEKKTEQKESK